MAEVCKLAMANPHSQEPDEGAEQSQEPGYSQQHPYADLTAHKPRMSLNELIDMDIHHNNEEIQKLMRRMKNSESSY